MTCSAEHGAFCSVGGTARVRRGPGLLLCLAECVCGFEEDRWVCTRSVCLCRAGDLGRTLPACHVDRRLSSSGGLVTKWGGSRGRALTRCSTSSIGVAAYDKRPYFSMNSLPDSSLVSFFPFEPIFLPFLTRFSRRNSDLWISLPSSFSDDAVSGSARPSMSFGVPYLPRGGLMSLLLCCVTPLGR